MQQASVAADSQEPRPVLSVANLVKIREKGGACFEMRVPLFSVCEGEFIAIVGASGCGKSTLLDILGLVLRADEVQHFDFAPRFTNKRSSLPLHNLPEKHLSVLRRREIGYVLQSGGLLPYLSVFNNIMLPCRLNNYPEEVCAERTRSLAQYLGIADQLEKKPAFLSGGQRQRVAIARALVHGPRLVLADEPTAAVDKITALEIRDAFRSIALSEKIGLVMVTHDRQLVRECTDRTYSFNLARQSQNHVCSTMVEVDNG
jgi:ABC-type antimicrobial peptide transport system, ATPase component